MASLFGSSKKAAAAPVKASSKKAAAPAKKMFGGAAPVNGAAKKSASSRVRDDDEEDGVAVGWGGAAKMRAEHSEFANRLNMVEETIVGKFGDDGPYSVVAMHWIQGKEGRRSYMCLGKNCPLCDIGDKPRVSNRFNFIRYTDSDPVVTSWDVGVRVMAKLEAAHKHPKYGPLSKVPYTIKRTGLKAKDTTYEISPVKRVSDIEEDFPDVVVPTAAQLAKLKLYTKEDTLRDRSSVADLQTVAAEMTGDESVYLENDD